MQRKIEDYQNKYTINSDDYECLMEARHPQNLICYISSVNLKFHGGTDTEDFPTKSIILGMLKMFICRLLIYHPV
jgi:hypothetical protein